MTDTEKLRELEAIVRRLWAELEWIHRHGESPLEESCLNIVREALDLIENI